MRSHLHLTSRQPRLVDSNVSSQTIIDNIINAIFINHHILIIYVYNYKNDTGDMSHKLQVDQVRQIIKLQDWHNVVWANSASVCLSSIFIIAMSTICYVSATYRIWINEILGTWFCALILQCVYWNVTDKNTFLGMQF